MPINKTIKVIVVDDSALVRCVLAEIINAEPDMTVVAMAEDPYAAREAIRTHNPDVITLDVEMPRMDGLDFLEKLMRLRPTPVVMVSTLTEQGSAAALHALELGAVDFVAKPKVDVARGMAEYAIELTQKIRTASTARLQPLRPSAASTATVAPSKPEAPPSILKRASYPDKLIAIGASTGGTEAIKEFLLPMPLDGPGIVITQHMPEGFTRMFAERLNKDCIISVSEAKHGDRIEAGHAYIAPGNRHLTIRRSAGAYVCELSDGPPVSRHKPSVDVLFDSVAKVAGKNAIGVIMTGMGRDGADGMLRMHQAGAYTFAQDEDTCVVFGMPKEAIAAGAVHEVVPIGRMLRKVLVKLEEMA